MVSIGFGHVIAVWSLCLLGGMGQVVEPRLPEMGGCPKWVVAINHMGIPVCGGALVTYVMVITGCRCVCDQYAEFIIRRPVEKFTITIEVTKAELEVDMIVPHPLCELNATLFAKFGTALVKAAWGISLHPKKVMPAPLFTLMLESEFEQFDKLLSMAVVKCVVIVKSNAIDSSPEAECRYRTGVASDLNVKLFRPTDCLQHCNKANDGCPSDLVEYDMHCLQVLSGGAKSYDPVQGTPLVCEGRTWGVMSPFRHDVDNIYFFYGVKSVVEIYSMAVMFSIGNDCGGNRIVISKMRTRRANRGVGNHHSSSALITVLLLNLCTIYIQRIV